VTDFEITVHHNIAPGHIGSNRIEIGEHGLLFG